MRHRVRRAGGWLRVEWWPSCIAGTEAKSSPLSCAKSTHRFRPPWKSTSFRTTYGTHEAAQVKYIIDDTESRSQRMVDISYRRMTFGGVVAGIPDGIYYSIRFFIGEPKRLHRSTHDCFVIRRNLSTT